MRLHLTLISTLVPSGTLAFIVRTNFSRGSKYFRKICSGGTNYRGEGSKLNVKGSLFCILGCNMVRSTISVVCGQSLYSLLENLRLFHRQLVIFHLGTKLNHLAHHTIATPHCTMLCIYLSAVCIC